MKEAYACYTGTADLFVYFFELGTKLLKPGGIQTFICSNKYFRAGYGKALRQYLAQHMHVRTLIDFGDAPVFDATAYPSIVVMQLQNETEQAAPGNENEFDAMTWVPGPRIEDFAAVFTEPRRVFRRQEILELLEHPATPKSVDVTVHKLRHRIGYPLITTVAGVGYSFPEAVERVRR